MNEVTLPAIDQTVIATLDTLTTHAIATEIEALKAIREKYAALARQNGHIKIADYSVSDSNWSREAVLHYERGGRKVKALLAFDNFGSSNTDQNSGSYSGDKLYLLESGEWLRIERDGRWSRWQGSPNHWGCGVSAAGTSDEYGTQGSIRIITDAEVEAEYPLDGIVQQLAKSLKTLAQKLPERMTRVKQRVELAGQLLAGLEGR